MATRQTVETLIQEIENNGNNTAKDVREVLTELLDYTENEEQGINLKPFDFNNHKKPTDSGTEARLLYSFRGFENFNVNFTIALKALKKNKAAFSFKLEPGLFPVLKDIIQQNKITFIVPVKRRQAANALANNAQNVTLAPMVLGLKEPDQLLLQFPNFEMIRFDIVYTSIQLHVPGFIDD